VEDVLTSHFFVYLKQVTIFDEIAANPAASSSGDISLFRVFSSSNSNISLDTNLRFG